jgi:predicted AAA+ superfamily ATPase
MSEKLIFPKQYMDKILRNSIRPFNYRGDIGKLMENAVYLHLLRNRYKVYVGKSGNKEIDFMAEKDGERIYVQVAYQLGDENIIKREFGNLAVIPDNYPKYVVTMDEIQSRNTYKGIRQLNLRAFLLETI